MRVLGGVLAMSVALAGCGSDAPDASPLYGAIHRYIDGFRSYDASEACGAMSASFYRALAGSLAAAPDAGSGIGRLSSTPGADCTAVLRAYFAAARRLEGPPSAPVVKLIDVRVHASAASATGVHGASREPFRFVRAGGAWRLDCCVGAQLDGQPSVSYRVPSASMEPTLRAGEIVTSDNDAFAGRAPALDEIVVLHPPAGADAQPAVCGDPHEGAGYRQPCGVPTSRESTETFLKRIVGLPGDRIAIVNGLVIRDGVSEGSAHLSACGSDAGICEFPQPIVVPAGEYYVMGDNRGVSDDSRFWGPVKRAWIVGLVTHY